MLLAAYARAFELEPSWKTSGNLNHEYGFTLVDAGDLARAREVFNQKLQTGDKAEALRSLALLDLYLGKYKDAKQNLQQALLSNVAAKESMSEARNHLFMSILLHGQGNEAGSLQELDTAIKTPEFYAPLQVWLASRIGVSYARSRLTEKAAGILSKIRKEVNTNNSTQNSEFHRLEGELEMARGNKVRAVEVLQVADRESRTALTVESLARAQEAKGDADNAIASYKTLIELRQLGWEPQQDYLRAHVQLAKLYVARHEPVSAKSLISCSTFGKMPTLISRCTKKR